MTFQQKCTNLRDFYLVKKGPTNLGIGKPPPPPFQRMSSLSICLPCRNFKSRPQFVIEMPKYVLPSQVLTSIYKAVKTACSKVHRLAKDISFFFLSEKKFLCFEQLEMWSDWQIRSDQALASQSDSNQDTSGELQYFPLKYKKDFFAWKSKPLVLSCCLFISNCLYVCHSGWK